MEQEILQCKKCETNLFHIIMEGELEFIECTGCKTRKPIKSQMPDPKDLSPEQLAEIIRAATSE